MPAPLEIALLFGGRSGEHEVSLRSAASVAAGLARHRVRPVLIDHDGRWFLQEGPEPRPAGGEPVFLAAMPTDEGRLRRISDAASALRPDIYFPVLHGPFGEDGTIQGLLELAGVPYVGAGVAASAAGMDKEMMKALFAAAGIPQTAYRVVRDLPQERDAARRLPDELGLPLFVKPANMGSSVAVSKVKRTDDLEAALDLALAFDRKAVVEAGIDAREIEVSIAGNEEPEASLPGEILPDREFYDYDSKYSDDSRTELKIPAPLGPEATEEVRSLGVRAFRAVDACGYARVDLLMERRSGRLHVNEINTIPGFTSISMFPKMWEAAGVPFASLLDRLLDLARDRHARRARLRTRYQP